MITGTYGSINLSTISLYKIKANFKLMKIVVLNQLAINFLLYKTLQSSRKNVLFLILAKHMGKLLWEGLFQVKFSSSLTRTEWHAIQDKCNVFCISHTGFTSCGLLFLSITYKNKCASVIIKIFILFSG